MSEFLDVGQWLSLVSGYRRKTNLPKTSAAKVKEFLKAAQTDIRDIIETSTPIMFVLDTKAYIDALNTFVNALKAGDSYYLQFVKEIPLQEGTVRPEDSNFLEELNKKLASWSVPDSISSKEKVSNILVTKSNTLESFSDVVAGILNNLNTELDRLLNTENQADPKTYEKGRRKVVASGVLMRKKISALTPCKLSNPESVIEGFDSNTQEIIMGVNFTSIRDRLNNYLNTEIKKYFTDIGVTLSDKNDKNNNLKAFAIGELVVFGHTGAKTTDKGVARLIGINTPWTQQLMLLAAQKGVQGNVFSVLDGFAQNSGQLDLSVQFTKEVSEKVGVLMKGQLSVIVPLTSTKNREILKTEEAAAAALIESIFGKGSTYRKVRGSLIDRVLDASNLLKLVTGLKFSPTLLQSFEKQYVEKLTTGKGSSVKASSKKETFSIIKDESVKIQKAVSSVRKYKLPKTTTKSKKSGTRAIPKSPANLVNLLNATLHDQIRKNMGTGDRRDVLNYRSGRFATSVKVEQVSTSRMGMITAFYTYMKNPYATFSRGGRQEFPRTRDPKLLISKSIREIASTLVTNQLRAVNV